VAAVPTCSVCKTAEHPKYKCPKCRETYCSIACCRKHKQEDGLCRQQQTTTKTPSIENSGEILETVIRSKYLCVDELKKIATKKQQQQQTAKTNNTESNYVASSRNQLDDDDDDDDEDEWKLTETMIQSMHNSDWLRQELQDIGLKHLITKITSASSTVCRQNNNRARVPLNASTTYETEQDLQLDALQTNNPLFRQFLDKLQVVTGVLERQGSEGEQCIEEWLLDDSGNHNNYVVLEPLAQRNIQRPLKKLLYKTSSEEESSTSSEESSSNSSQDDKSSDGDDATR
jgi:hypothetical protein